MHITNKHGLPEAFVEAVKSDAEPRDYYSPSMLNDSPRIVHLLRRHWKECAEDAVDSVWKLFGTAVHHVLEKHGSGQNELTVKGEFMGHSLQGKIDMLDSDGVLRDWKVTSAWTIVYGSKLEDWTIQLNAYRRMLEQMGHEVKGMEVIAILRDWTKSKAKDSDTYPQAQVQVVKIDKLDDIDALIADRLDELEHCANLFDDELPYCTNKDKWQDDDKYAVMMKGKKRAVKLHTNIIDAEEHAANVGGYVEERKGYPRRCLEYCPVREFCNQFKEEN